MMRPLCCLVLFCLSLGIAAPAPGAPICGYREMGVVEVIRKGVPIAHFTVTLAATADRRRRGLMHCRSLDPGTGMLFTYPDAGRRAFWMKHTVIELAIVFVSAQGRIVAIEHGRPGSRDRIWSPDRVQSVLEINFEESGRLAVGDQLRLRLHDP
jgi:uncharacterized membrane protein (UPF0127 family)